MRRRSRSGQDAESHRTVKGGVLAAIVQEQRPIDREMTEFVVVSELMRHWLGRWLKADWGRGTNAHWLDSKHRLERDRRAVYATAGDTGLVDVPRVPLSSRMFPASLCLSNWAAA